MFDTTIISLIQSFQSPALTNFFLTVTKVGDAHIVIFVGIFVAVILYLKKKYFYAHGLLISLLLSGALTYIIKNTIERARPLNGLIMESGFSFPSGHSLLATTLIGFLIYIIYKYHDSHTFKITAITILSILLVCVLISRIYLGIHYPTDVIAGFLCGLLSIVITLMLKRYNVLHQKFMKSLYTQ